MDEKTLEAARAVAFRYIGYTPRSRAEVSRRLERGDFPPDVAAKVVEECEARGWLDDAAFAQRWVEDRADRKRYGKSRISAELRRKGVDKETVEQSLDTVNEEDEKRRALEAARTKWRLQEGESAGSAEFLAEKRRVMQFLQRRGFSWHIIMQVIEEMIANTK